VPFARLDPWPESLSGLDDHGFRILALTPDPSAPLLGDVDNTTKVALMLGAEGPGLSPAALARAHGRVRIEMADNVDSVNVATAGAIAFHHFFRPR
jgi:tRNA G18 (ribose-2'-O)-methylase SpoU